MDLGDSSPPCPRQTASHSHGQLLHLGAVCFLALDSRGCRAQGRGQAWIDLECHDVSYFTKAL